MKDLRTRTTSSHWGAFNVTTRDNRIVSVDTFDKDPSPSTISKVLPEAVHHSSRVARPSFRKSWLEQGPCLLYTSPSPRDATLSRMPSSA